MRVYIGADHAGYQLKEHVERFVADLGHDVTDIGTDGEESVDYPDFAEKVGEAVVDGDAEFGVLVCGTGIGMAIAANKVDGIRAANVTDPEFAKLARAHNDANVITVSGRFVDPEVNEQIIEAFLATPFEGGRHERRVNKINGMENHG